MPFMPAHEGDDLDMHSAANITDPALTATLLRLRNAYQANRYPGRAQRLDWLARVAAMTQRHGDAIVDAIRADFGHRARQETQLTELWMMRASARQAQRHLSAWMKPQRAATALQFLPGKNRLLRQPLGVIGIIAPWNYPYQLAIGPAIAALAAGNRVMIKPSELTPRFADLLSSIVAEYFTADEIAVTPGDMEVGKAFASLPFDHLVFTGSTATGRQVALAAARNLTPVTLELGGKSPAIIDPSANIALAAKRLAFGKLLNAGQTCIAPDYLLVPENRCDELVAALTTAASQLYPSIADNPDYTAIINPRHRDRLQALLEDAIAHGARMVPLTNAGDLDIKRAQTHGKCAPMLVLNATPDMRIMQEEIFGPLLPVVTYRDHIQQAIDFVNQRERPLALYWYGEDNANRDRVLEQTVSGGVTINDCLWHMGQESQPFGGVGASGMGAYHGEWGFRAFSKEKPVFYQSRWSGIGLFYPPYGKTFERMLRLLKSLI